MYMRNQLKAIQLLPSFQTDCTQPCRTDNNVVSIQSHCRPSPATHNISLSAIIFDIPPSLCVFLRWCLIFKSRKFHLKWDQNLSLSICRTRFTFTRRLNNGILSAYPITVIESAHSAVYVYASFTVYQSPKFLVASICRMSSTVSSASLLQHFRDPCNICRRTNSLEFTAWLFVRSSCWLGTI